MAGRFLILTAALITAIGEAANPAADAVLELPRDEPIHYVDAVLALINLGEPESAAKVADELIAIELTDAERVVLVDEAGSAKLMRVASETPAAAEWVASTLRAAESANTSPERMGRLVDRLKRGDADGVRATMLELERTGLAGVNACVNAIPGADERGAARLREALVALYPESGPTLVVALEASDADVRTQAAYAWGRLADLDRVRSPLPAALLAGPALSGSPDDRFGSAARWAYARLTGSAAATSDADAAIDGAIDQLLAGSLPFPTDADGFVAWPSDPGGATERLATGDIAIAIAAKLASDAAQLRAGEISAERRAMLLSLESGRPWTGDAKLSEQPTYALGECLAMALDAGFAKASISCCGLLGEREDAAALVSPTAQPAPLARALRSRYSAVRFAALEAIIAIDSPAPFPGSSEVRDALRYFAAGAGSRSAVVVAPQIARASNLAGYLATAGYYAAPVNNGLAAVRAAASSPDVEMILLDVDTIRPSARETLFRLRRTPATATTPIGLLAADGRYGAAQALAADHDGVLVSARLHSPGDAQAFAERLARLAPRTAVTPEERREQAATARQWIARLLEEGPAYYRLRDNAESLETTLGSAGDVVAFGALASIGTPASQRRLADEASRFSAPIATRRAAAEAFIRCVRQHGVLLTSGEITRQYERYNSSETADADTQAVLGSLLDAIESRRDRGGSRIRGEAP